MFDRKDMANLAMKPRQPTSTSITLEDQPQSKQFPQRDTYRDVALVCEHKIPFPR